MFDGGCECGNVRYRLTSAPFFVNCCHCRQCQKLSGSAFACNGMIEADCVELVGACSRAIDTVAGTSRCPACSTLLWATHRDFGDRILFVRLGTLDESDRIAPDAHFFVRSIHPWIKVPEGTPCFDTLPGEGDPPLFSDAAAARLEAALRRRPGPPLAGCPPPR
jgi:hypothetical protein